MTEYDEAEAIFSIIEILSNRPDDYVAQIVDIIHNTTIDDKDGVLQFLIEQIQP